MDASTYVLLFITPINIALNVYFVRYAGFGIYGSPIALSFTFSLAFFFLIVYTAYSPTHARNQTWGGLQLRAALDARSCVAFLKLAIPGILMFGTEWCVRGFLIAVTLPLVTPVLILTFRAAFEIVALAAARLGTDSLAAQSIIMTTDQSTFFPPPSF
jgi:MATE family multidrug resistance protein